MENHEYFDREIPFDHPELFIVKESPKEDKRNYVRIRQMWTCDESGVVWDAALLMAKYLEQQCHRSKSNLSTCNIIELGAGTGFLGIWCAALGASTLITDLEENLHLIRLNVEENHHIDNDKMHIMSFDWSDKSKYEYKFLQWKPLNEINYVLISDCLYYHEGMIAIYDFINWILSYQHLNVKSKTSLQVLVSYEDREDKLDICQDFLKRIRQNDSLKLEFISKEHLHPDYFSDDLHLLRISCCDE